MQVIVASPLGGDTLGMRRFDELSDGEKTERLGRLAEKALLGYGLSGSLSHVATSTHTVFQLRLGGVSYGVRVSPPGYDHLLLRRELVWLAALGRDTDLRVPEPVLAVTGDLFRSVSMEGVPGTRACTVRRWIDGERREAELAVDEAAAMGCLAATLHVHTQGFRWPEELTPEYVHPAERVVVAADHVRGALASPADRSRLYDAVTRIAETTSALGDGPDSVGVVHGDLRLRKLRHANGDVGAFGFDACRRGAYLDDLSVVWSELAGRESTPALRRALLDGYRTIHELPDAVEGSLDAFCALRTIEEAGQLCALRPGRAIDPSLSQRVTALVCGLPPTP